MSIDPMYTTGSPLQQPTPLNEWFEDSAVEGTVVALPSGKFARVRITGMEAFIEAGMIPNSLLSIVQEALQRGKPPTEEFKKLENDPEALKTIADMCNRVAEYCFMEPRVYHCPVGADGKPDPHLKEKGKLYSDMVALADKFFVFQLAVGGTRNLETFRGNLDTAMESLSASQPVAGSPLPAPRH